MDLRSPCILSRGRDGLEAQRSEKLWRGCPKRRDMVISAVGPMCGCYTSLVTTSSTPSSYPFSAVGFVSIFSPLPNSMTSD